eukprot:ANDGO_01842.mRNA.1 hypothetical protein
MDSAVGAAGPAGGEAGEVLDSCSIGDDGAGESKAVGEQVGCRTGDAEAADVVGTGRKGSKAAMKAAANSIADGVEARGYRRGASAGAWGIQAQAAHANAGTGKAGGRETLVAPSRTLETEPDGLTRSTDMDEKTQKLDDSCLPPKNKTI